jgi:hypothetical protein
MSGVGVQGMDQRRAFHHEADPRVAMAVDPPLVTLRQAEPTLQLQVVADLLVSPLADEQTGQKACHHHGHLSVNRVIGLPEAID